MNYLNCKRWKWRKGKKCYQKMKIFNFENINPLWVLPNKFLLKCWTIFIHNIWVLLIENDKNDKGLTPIKDGGTCLRRLSMFRKEVH